MYAWIGSAANLAVIVVAGLLLLIASSYLIVRSASYAFFKTKKEFNSDKRGDNV